MTESILVSLNVRPISKMVPISRSDWRGGASGEGEGDVGRSHGVYGACHPEGSRKHLHRRTDRCHPQSQRFAVSIPGEWKHIVILHARVYFPETSSLRACGSDSLAAHTCSGYRKMKE